MENPNINYANLTRMADYIETIPQKMFTMKVFITSDVVRKYKKANNTDIFIPTLHTVEHKCNTVGCTIGHCLALDLNVPRYLLGDFKYEEWVQDFTGIDPYENKRAYDYLFSMRWAEINNTPKGAAERIRTFIASGIPENWRNQF